MKHFLRRVSAFCLSARLLISTCLASYALGDDLHKYSVRLSDGAVLSTEMFWSNSNANLRRENYVTYTPGSSLSPLVDYGNSVLAKSTVSSMANHLEQSGERVLSGINGDYFVMATGDPLGIVVTDGLLRSSSSYLSAVGFIPDGSAIIGKPELSMIAKFSGVELKIADMNKIRTATGGYYLLTRDFGATTQNTEPGIDVVLAPQSTNLGTSVTASNGQSVTLSNTLKIGSQVNCIVESVHRSGTNLAIPEGKFVITINNKSNDWLVSMLSDLQPGATMDIEITSPDTRWNHVDSALGALYRILTDGTVNGGLDDAAAPRTAIGTKPDGSVIFYTIDGRQKDLSIGASMTQVANRLSELGCTNAVCVDGGGSTTLGATMPDSTGFSIVNSPSDGSQRAVTNALFLVSNLSASGVPGSLYVKPQSRTLLPGSSTQCSTSFVDTNWHPLNYSDSIAWSAKYGSIDQNGFYTAPANGCTDEITATSPSGASGTATVTIFPNVDSIRVSYEDSGSSVDSLSLSAGSSVNLRASSTYRLIPLTGQDKSYSWSVSPSSLGSFTSDGIFTAADSGTGTITVSACGQSVSIPVSVSGQTTLYTDLLEDFEVSISSFTPSDSFRLSHNTAADQVRYGFKSLRADYTLQADTAQMDLYLPLPSGASYASLWVYGDSSNNSYSITCQDSQGKSHAIYLGSLNFTGWKQVWATLPADAAAITQFTISGNKSSGTIWLDQISTSNKTTADQTAPTVSLSVSGNQLSASVSDNSIGTLSKRQMAVYLDGNAVDFSFNSSNNSLSATLPDLSSSLHRVTVTATDNSGNIGRASQILNSEGSESSFLDMKYHWARTYTEYLHQLDIVVGMSTSGGYYFDPDQNITRGDFALMTARWMGLDLDSYASISLPFVDSASIPSWSLNAVKAMYSLGIMMGSQDPNGLSARANDSITRAEAMSLLARTQIKGYPAVSLSSFHDAGDVPAWASDHVASLVGQDVVNGDGGKLRPEDPIRRAEAAKLLVFMW